MDKKQIVIRRSVSINIAKAASFIEPKGLMETAEKFSNSVYNFIEKPAGSKIQLARYRESMRKSLGFKCVAFKNDTITLIETDILLTICEFLPSKLIHW